MNHLMLLGEDETAYGRLTCRSPLPGLAGALSVGADPASPSLGFKGHKSFPNEDGLLAGWDDDWLLLAVTDGHFGREGSHSVLTRLSELPGVPRSRGELALTSLSLADPPWRDPAGTTLLVLCLERSSGNFFGYSWGDSRACRLSQAGAVYLNASNQAYLRGADPDPEAAEYLEGQLQPDETLLLFTDGVNECHYRSPLTSVQPEDLQALAGQAPEALVRALGQLALGGVRGSPGGQDNLAILAAVRRSLP